MFSIFPRSPRNIIDMVDATKWSNTDFEPGAFFINYKTARNLFFVFFVTHHILSAFAAVSSRLFLIKTHGTLPTL